MNREVTLLLINREQVIPWKKTQAAEVTMPGFPQAWITAAGAATLVFLPTVVQASATSEKIVRAFRPLTDLIQGLSYPIAFLGLSSGFLLYMTGNRERGLQLIKSAAIGYIGLQFVPTLMSLLVEVGRAMMAP